MNRFSRFFLFALLAIALPVMAQDWPKRPVRIIVPYAPGGNTDAIARITAERLAQPWASRSLLRTGAAQAVHLRQIL